MLLFRTNNTISDRAQWYYRTTARGNAFFFFAVWRSCVALRTGSRTLREPNRPPLSVTPTNLFYSSSIWPSDLPHSGSRLVRVLVVRLHRIGASLFPLFPGGSWSSDSPSDWTLWPWSGPDETGRRGFHGSVRRKLLMEQSPLKIRDVLFWTDLWDGISEGFTGKRFKM